MSIDDGGAYDPRMQYQGPASNCVIAGKALGWLSCSAYGMAMGVDDATIGLKRPSGCSIRRRTGDTSGGLTLRQVANAAFALVGVYVDVRVGSGVIAPSGAARALREGRSFGLQGNTGALIGTPSRSTGTGVNHYVHVSRGRGWQQVGGLWRPAEALVFDPAADGRWGGWGMAAKGPDWWPWSRVLDFAATLRPWGDTDPRKLGPGKMYAGFFPDAEPHVHLRWSARRTVPWPDRTRVEAKAGLRVNVYDRPDHVAGRTVRTLPADALFVAQQVTTSGALYRDSRKWYGNHAGTEWIHEYRLRREGGTT